MLASKAVEQYELFLQPICDLNKNTVGYETLLRVVEGELRLSAEKIILNKESNKTIHELDLFVLEQLSVIVAGNRNNDLFITVNVSALSIENDLVAERLLKYGVGILNHGVEVYFEVTETAKANIDSITRNCHKFIANGVKIILDDYGSGFNPFGLLGRIDAHAVKISKELLDDMNRKRSYNMMVKAAEWIKSMGALLIIEGVEREEQLQSVKDIGFDYVQGYLIGRPQHYEFYQKNIVPLP